MTSFAFILGCVPLWIASGAGAVARQIMGTTVIGGMLAASAIGIFFIPAIFYLVEKAVRARTGIRPRPSCRPIRRRRKETEMRFGLTAASVAALVLTGCTVGPNYQRPQVKIPDNFRAPEPLPAPQAASLADLKWFEVFKDARLQDLIRTALAANYDLRDAVARVEQARASLDLVRVQPIPAGERRRSVGSHQAFAETARRRCRRPFLASQNRNWGEAMLNLLSFEVDIWGRLRRSTEAARANLLSAEDNRKGVVVTLVSDVATAYLHLRELDYELEISKQTLANRQDSLNLTIDRQKGGVATLLDLRQAEQLVEVADETIPAVQQQIEQTENQITLLLGQNPGGIVRGQDFIEQDLPPEVPAGLPSALLERRPDILAAEQNLIAANANIGVAKAEYFPQISLSGFLGGRARNWRACLAGRTAPGVLCRSFAADFCRRCIEVEYEACESRAGRRARSI